MNDVLGALQTEARLSPHDDVPRLVLADWLEENGDEVDRSRAEFIRIQCSLARPRVAGRADLEWRERSLWWENVEAWLGPVYDASTGFRFRRGLATIDLDAERVRAAAVGPLFASACWAWVDQLNLSNARPDVLAALLHGPAAAWLRVLRLERGEEVWGAGLDLEACENLGLLQELTVRHTGLDDEGVGLLARCPSLTGLAALDLGYNLLHGPGLEALAHAPALGALRSLELVRNPLGYDRREAAVRALRRFFNGPLARRLARLGLAETALGPAGVELLAASSALGGLQELDLGAVGLDDDAAVLLAGSPALGGLRRLNLRDNEIYQWGAEALARSPHLEQIEQLDLAGNPLGAEGLRVLARAPRWNPRKLRLGRVRPDPRLLGELRARYGAALDLG
jgi:uncharacterized protein (TIGR02996 family)